MDRQLATRFIVYRLRFENNIWFTLDGFRLTLTRQPTPLRIIIIAAFILIFDLLYFLSFKKIALLYLLNSDLDNVENILNFQFTVNAIIFPLVWFFIVSMVHLTADLFGGTGSYKLLLYQSSFIFIPLTAILIFIISFTIVGLEGKLIWEIKEETSMKEISQMILSSSEIEVIKILFRVFYFIAVVWIAYRIKQIYSISLLVSFTSIISPFILIYLLTILIKL